MNMYYLALVAPEEINRQVLQWKNWMRDQHKCVAALKSPAHITLIPPFWMSSDLEKKLFNQLDSFAQKQQSFHIELLNFSSFKPKVIFVAVVPNKVLNSLKIVIENYFVKTELFPIRKDERSFHPHITIATRDLYKKSFNEAWNFFEKKEFDAGWKADNISILRHNKKNWDVIYTSQFICN